MQGFGIIDYIGGLTGFVLDKSVLVRIAIDRQVYEKRPQELTQKDKDLITADILHVIYMSPNTMASRTSQHGSYTRTIGSQTLQDRTAIYEMMKRLYRKWDDSKADEIEAASGGLQWLE